MVSVLVWPPLKRTWTFVIPSSDALMSVSLRDSFLRRLDERDILDDIGKQSLAFEVRRIRIGPEFVEVHGHCDEPLADIFVEDEPILLSGAISILACFGQDAELLIPFAFERRRPGDYWGQPA